MQDVFGSVGGIKCFSNLVIFRLASRITQLQRETTILLGPPKQVAGAWRAGQGPQLSQVMEEGGEGQILTLFSCL